MDPSSSSLIRFQCILHDQWVLFKESWNLYKLRRGEGGGPNFWGEPILQKVWIIWSPLLYFNFKSFMDSISASFITFECTLHDSGVHFAESWNLYKLKMGDQISRGTNFAESLNYFVPFLYFNFQSFEDQNYFPFIRFQCILHDSGVLFAECWNFYKLKEGDLISGVTNFAESLNYLVPPPVYIF